MRRRSLLAVLATAMFVMGCTSSHDLVRSVETPSPTTSGDLELIALSTNTALESLPSNVANSWDNPASNHAGSVTPIRTVKVEQPRGFCRVYLSRVFDRLTFDELETTKAMACRLARHNWVPCSVSAKVCVEELERQ